MSNQTLKTEKTTKTLLSPGHRACAGCGQIIAARLVIDTLGPNTIIANATGCLEVTTTPYPQSAWGVPWVHSLFENASSVASGIAVALKHQGKNKDIKILAQGGDGGTFDIGMGQLSGMWERGEDIIYVCYDNEAYSNTGFQASGATPWAAYTSTTPSGKSNNIDAIGSHQRKKDMIAIALAHGLRYVAQTTVGFPDDIIKKVKKAAATPGPSYIQILSSCVPGWGINPSETINLAKMAAFTGLYPVIEYVDGRLNEVIKVPNPVPPVSEYLKPQVRFKHLFKVDKNKTQINMIQKIADENIVKYGLK